MANNDGATSGDGSTAPFGDGNGATSGGASSGAHDFLTDPESNSPKTGGRDFTKESRPQKDGAAPDLNQESVPEGGTMPFAKDDAIARGMPDVGTIVGDEKHKPFKLGGG